jgi:hypothetical protein
MHHLRVPGMLLRPNRTLLAKSKGSLQRTHKPAPVPATAICVMKRTLRRQLLAQCVGCGSATACRRSGGGFNGSAQHLLLLRGEEVCDGDVTNLVHGSVEGRAVGAMERAKYCGHLTGAGKEEQDRR